MYFTRAATRHTSRAGRPLLRGSWTVRGGCGESVGPCSGSTSGSFLSVCSSGKGALFDLSRVVLERSAPFRATSAVVLPVFARPDLCSFIDRWVSAHAACELCGMRGMDSPRVNLPVPLPSRTRHPVIPVVLGRGSCSGTSGEAASRSCVVMAVTFVPCGQADSRGEGRRVMVARGGDWGDVKFRGWSLS